MKSYDCQKIQTSSWSKPCGKTNQPNHAVTRKLLKYSCLDPLLFDIKYGFELREMLQLYLGSSHMIQTCKTVDRT